MGSSYTGPAPENTASMLQAYGQYLPTISSEMAGAIPNLAQAQAGAAALTQPQYNALNLQQLNRFALPEAQIGQQVSRSDALAGAETNRQQLAGAGGDAARTASALNRETNPDYYTAQDAASKGAADAVNAINLGGLSPGEAAAVERSNNQGQSATGNLGNINGTNVISNALNFGGAFNNKVALKNQAVNAATGAAGSASSNGGFNGVNVALGQPNVGVGNNMGTNQFTGANAGTQASSAGNVFNFGSGLLNNMTSGNNAAISSQTQGNIAGGIPSYLGAVCCFIFLEAYKGEIPWYVRHGRDKYYHLNHDMATGYRRMARWLVPLMQKSYCVRQLVWLLMIVPITNHLAFASRKRKGNRVNRFICHAWLRVWCALGKGKDEKAYQMTWNYPIVALS